MRIFLERNPSNQPGEILAHVKVSETDDSPALRYSHSFIYKVHSGDDGEIIVYTSKPDATSGVNGRRFLFDLEKCNNEKCKNTPGGCQEIKSNPKRLLVADVFHTKPKQNALQFFGAALFKALFSEDAEKVLRETPNGRILLQLNDRDLDAIPWEYAKDGTSFLVHDRMFTRLLAHEYEISRDLLPELPLHIVVVAPDPLDLTEKGYADLRLGDQFQNLVNEFRGDKINVMLERVLPATVNMVNSLIANPDDKMAPVLHFMGHCVAHNTGRGLLFEDRDTFKCDVVHTQSLINVPRNLRLAFLSACNSREVARVLAQNGVRHTIGSYCDLPDDIARKFEAQYYQYLSYGLSVDEAMWRSRMAYRNSDDLRQNDYLAGAMILYSATCHMDDSKFLREAGVLKIERNMCANNLDDIPSAKIFFGRKNQLADLNVVLRRMATRTSESADVYTITGICGQGKTTLAMKAVRRNSHFFPGGIFAWQFNDKKEISFRDFLRKLAGVLFSKLLLEGAQNSADEVEILKQAITKEFNASTLLILDHADTLIRAAKVGGDASDLVIWLQNIVSLENLPVKILATSTEPLKWSEEKPIPLDGFIDSDIHSGCTLFFRYLNEEAKETIMANKQRKELLRDIVTRVDGHPLSLILLSRMGDKLLEDIAHKHYRAMLADNQYLKSLRDHFGPMINALPKKWRLLLYICSLSALPAGKENLIKVSKFFDHGMISAESVNALGDLDIKQLHRRGLLIKEGDDKYKCPVAIWVIAKDFHSDFILRTNHGATPLYQAVELLHKTFSGEFAAEMNAKDHPGWTPLHLAANNGQVDLVKSLLDFGADANCKCDVGQAPLHFAARFGYVEVVKLLATSGADVNVRNNSDRTPLYMAASYGYIEVIKLLVTSGADVNAKCDNGWAALHIAAHDGFVEVVKLLVTIGADVNAKCDDGRTALHIAAGDGHASLVELFVGDFKVYQDIRESKDWTPLHFAAAGGHVEIVKLLVGKFHADMNAMASNNRTLLYIASWHGRVEVVKLLVTSGADVNAKCENDWTALHCAANNGHVGVVKLLATSGADLNARTNIDRTPLFLAVWGGYIEVVKSLVAFGADVNAKCDNGRTALHTAAYFGFVEVVKFLVTSGADLSAKYDNGWTALHTAAHTGFVEVVKLLATSGADVNAKRDDGLTALHIAAEDGHASLVELLVGDFKVYQDIRESEDWTPLHYAAHSGHVEVVKLLVDKFHADMNAMARNNLTLLYIAAAGGHIEVIKLLVTSGADVNAKCENDWAALHIAAKNGHVEVVKLLATSGADVNAKCNDSRTALHIAACNGRVEVVKSLVGKFHADMNAKSNEGRTPLQTATQAGYPEVARLLATFM